MSVFTVEFENPVFSKTGRRRPCVLGREPFLLNQNQRYSINLTTFICKALNHILRTEKSK